MERKRADRAAIESVRKYQYHTREEEEEEEERRR